MESVRSFDIFPSIQRLSKHPNIVVPLRIVKIRGITLVLAEEEDNAVNNGAIAESTMKPANPKEKNLLRSKLTNERPAKTKIRFSLASHSNIYPLRIAKDVLVDVTGYVYLMNFMILDIKEDERRPFILGKPFLTTAKVVIKFDKGTITLRSRKSKISFQRIPELQGTIKKGIKNDIEPIAPMMTINRLFLKWEEKIKLPQEKKMQFKQWRSKILKNKLPALMIIESGVADEGEQAIDVESTSDNDARDQASELETKVLVDGKQDDAKVVGMADEQNSDEPNLLEGNEGYRIHHHMEGSYYSFPYLILSTGKDCKTPEEKKRNDNDDTAADGDINGIDTEMPVKEAEKETEAENGTKNKPIKRAEREATSETSSSQPVRIRVGKVKGKTYNLLHRGPVYEAILRKNITRKDDIGENFEIPCNIGGLKRMNSPVDQGSDVNVMPLSTYVKITNEMAC
nr:hypothetical protein [Tanacetum cinerariifolium]